jgi:hypothetical protein
VSADGTNGVRVEPITAPITIDVRREPNLPDPESEPLVERAWQRLCADNPRYFNGRILSFESYDANTGIACARDVEYRLHAVRESVDSGIAFFGVTGVLRVIDSGTARFMLGKRGISVHEYPNQWELAPCGGIDPPPPGQDTLSPGEIARELWREGHEELGLNLDGIEPEPIALVHDDPVGSTDLMMLLDLPGIPTSGRNWEYSQSRWLTLDEIDALHASPGESVIPTTLAMLAHLRRGMPPV